MNILDRFEQGFERLMEGSIGRVFRSPIQPAEIGRKLERAMTGQQVVSVGATLVPNEYRVVMHPQDMVLFVGYVGAISRQMEQWLTEVAAERGFTLVDRVRVQIAAEERVPRRAIRVAAAIQDRPELGRAAQDEVQRTEVYRVIRATGGMPPLRLRVGDGAVYGQDVLLRKSVTNVGRALDNDVVLESADVSRHHARFEYDGDVLRLLDLGSTNGTRLNGRPVTSDRVRPGDEIVFGTLPARLLPFGAESVS
ncbi:MAG: hypothetical protein AVDCRST_MAG19-2802 [uncultured Thermomicrobiales bacterium]|uniref:FHA domain-containing protein n=1 Tax=uncultured Thermomicrobiales bacterium TaxID=1645740 RepID=A0A6J4V829_9BACT|nr:MAG: hypothetical protein AVDCRST_MAG19-2802 [uncultured Thermomicrobiales bacterium]